ncbi:MAG: response regulator [Pseudomonadales bacterium]|nr:response regulator [Pseudomonadales bacterium]
MSDSLNPVIGEPMKVLIVDDSFLMRRIIRNILEKDDTLVVVGEASDGVIALEKASELAPDVILLDIEMPNMDGIEFLRRSRLSTSAKIIIISSVARIDSPEAREVLELGAADIIPKPSGVLSLDFEEQKSRELLDAIHKCL